MTPLMQNPAPSTPKAFIVFWVVCLVVVKSSSVHLIPKTASALGHSITEAPYLTVPSLSPSSKPNPAF